jgi:hypothetical protein
MLTKNKLQFSIFLTLLLYLTFTGTVNSQAQGGGINKWLKKQTDKVSKVVNKVFYGTSNGRPKLSELNDKDFIQNKGIPTQDKADTRFNIAKNLQIDIKGKYPLGYNPKWRFISYNHPLSCDVENWLFPRANIHHEDKNLSIGDYNGKAVIRWDAFITCECFADIIVKDSIAVITETPQTFELANFRKILNERSTGEPCRGIGSWHHDGGWAGKITLSANQNGDILMDLMIENYSQDHNGSSTRYIPSQVSLRYIAKNITIENEMSAEKATEKVRQEQQDKQRQKDYLVRTIRQADSIQKIISKKFPQKSCRDCFYSSSGGYISTSTVEQYYVSTGNYAGSRTDWDLNIKTEIKNKCNYNLMFIGIQQFYDEASGYYLKEVTKVMPANYSYSSDQGIVTSFFSSLIGGGSEFNIKLQDKYYPGYATLGSVQWIKVIRK